MAAGECQCPKVELADWRDREVALVGHHFVSAPIRLFFHVPRGFFRELETLRAKAQQSGLRTAPSPLVLHRDGWFSGEVLLSVEPPAGGDPGAGTFQNLFYSRVVERPGFDAAFRAMPRFYRDLRAARVGRIDAMYFWYLNCPGCLIERGARQVILLARCTKVLAYDPCPAADLRQGMPALLERKLHPGPAAV